MLWFFIFYLNREKLFVINNSFRFSNSQNPKSTKKDLLRPSNLFGVVENDWILRICLPEPSAVGCYRSANLLFKTTNHYFQNDMWSHTARVCGMNVYVWVYKFKNRRLNWKIKSRRKCIQASIIINSKSTTKYKAIIIRMLKLYYGEREIKCSSWNDCWKNTQEMLTLSPIDWTMTRW